MTTTYNSANNDNSIGCCANGLCTWRAYYLTKHSLLANRAWWKLSQECAHQPKGLWYSVCAGR